MEADELTELQVLLLRCSSRPNRAYTIHVHTPCTPHLHPTQEQLEALAEAYADPQAEKMSSDDEGDEEID